MAGFFLRPGKYDMPAGPADPQYLHLLYRSPAPKVADEIKKNYISWGHYKSGHMVYIDQPSAAKYHADPVKFVQASLPK